MAQAHYQVDEYGNYWVSKVSYDKLEAKLEEVRKYAEARAMYPLGVCNSVRIASDLQEILNNP